MAKFYASCGSQTLIISAPTAEFAAMRLIYEAMSAHIWIYEDGTVSEKNRWDHLVLEALLHLSPTVCVSERGLGHNEATEIGVPELLLQWHRLMTGLSRMISAIGFSGRSLLPKPIGDSDAKSQSTSSNRADQSSGRSGRMHPR